jgi:hypothetical protein
MHWTDSTGTEQATATWDDNFWAFIIASEGNIALTPTVARSLTVEPDPTDTELTSDVQFIGSGTVDPTTFTGAYSARQIYANELTGQLWFCTAGGNPGTWVAIGGAGIQAAFAEVAATPPDATTELPSPPDGYLWIDTADPGTTPADYAAHAEVADIAPDATNPTIAPPDGFLWMDTADPGIEPWDYAAHAQVTDVPPNASAPTIAPPEGFLWVDTAGDPAPPVVGIPGGGEVGGLLSKVSGGDYDVGWTPPPNRRFANAAERDAVWPNPTSGDTCWLLDTHTQWVFRQSQLDGTMKWFGLPMGIIASVNGPAAQMDIGAANTQIVALPPLTFDPGRRYAVHAQMTYQAITADGSGQADLRDWGTPEFRVSMGTGLVSTVALPSLGYPPAYSVQAFGIVDGTIFTGARNLQIMALASPGAIRIGAGAAYIMLEDVGSA